MQYELSKLSEDKYLLTKIENAGRSFLSGIPSFEEFLSNEDEWHYFVGGIAIGAVVGVIVASIVYAIIRGG